MSPLLFAIFTGWLYDELCLRVGKAWADEFITLYADDSLLQWLIQNTADLEYMCKCIRATFKLLKETGMQVNAAKSQLIIQLQGATGKRWLKAHLHRAQDGFTVSVGTPSDPIHLPRVSSFTYLGVTASLGNYEMQTCRHRLRAGAQVRHRLLRVLHSAGLRLRQRAVLYQACVRSSILYGLHAVGVTPSVLRKLEAQDAKGLRGIAKSPAHLWHEHSHALRVRMGVKSIRQMLVKLYLGRSKRCSDVACSQWFLEQWSWLRQTEEMQAGSSHGIRNAACVRAVACERCGQYFTSMGQVRRHMKRVHGVEPGAAKPPLSKWHQHMVDGMPLCKHCGKQFTRVEGFRKHIRRSCIVLHGHHSGCVDKPAEGMEPSTGERPQGHSCRASPTAPEAKPLIELPEFRAKLLPSWKQVLHDSVYRQSLRTYCLLCGQWVSMSGPGVKQHIRLMHPEAWKHKDRAASRCSSLALSVAVPCAYCGIKVQDVRTHHKRCSAIFQASLAEIIAREDYGCSGADGDRPVPGCPGTASGGAGKCHTLLGWRSGTKVGEGGGGGSQGASDEVSQGPAQGHVWERLEGGSRLGQELVGELQGQAASRSGGKLPDLATQHLLQTLVKMVTRHEEELARIRIDTNFMLFMDVMSEGVYELMKLTAEQWHEKFTAKKVTASLRVMLMLALLGEIQDRMVKTVESDEQLARCINIGWMAEGSTRLNPVYRYFRWNPDTKAQEQCDTPPLTHTAALTHVQTLQEMVVLPNVLTRFRSTRPLAKDSKGEVVPFLLSLSLRQTQAGRCHEALMALSGCACLKLAGLRLRPDRGQKQPLMKELEQVTGIPCGSVYGLDGTRADLESQQPVCGQACGQVQPGGRRAEVGGAQLVLRATGFPATPVTLVGNSGNICYLNAVAQAIAWLGACADRPKDCYGKAAVALQKAIASGKHLLPGSLPWMPILSNWPQLHRQQDAGSFCAHLLAYASPPGFGGEWQARLSNPDMTVDSGPLLAPLSLEVQGPDLQSAVDAWATQHAVRGLYLPTGVLVLQLKRYERVAEGLRKCTSPVTCRPGERIGFPVFLGPTGLDTRTETYRLISCVFHTGHQLDSGHYQAVLCVPAVTKTAVSSSPKPCTPLWSYRICDDNRKPRQTRPKEVEHISENVYLLGFLRDPGGA